MDIAIILTYRCSSRCSMCNVWKNPSAPAEEVSLETLSKLPYGFDYVNLTGGEPTLRADLEGIVDLLYPRAGQLEISTNGVRPEKLVPIICKYPDIKIRFSLEGFGKTNDEIRGEPNGFQKKVDGLLRLQEVGGRDLGFAITIQDENADELVKLFEFSERHGFELATSTLHNGFQFHKADNVLYDRVKVARQIERLVAAQLGTWKVKNWFRAYLNLGIVARALGHDRLLTCTAARDFVFVDPWAAVFACNVRPDLQLGSLEKQSWEEIVGGPRFQEVRECVQQCQQNCWMAGSAKTAMRTPRFAHLPRWTPLAWVMMNKLKLMLGREINFDHYIDHSTVFHDPVVPRRQYYSAQYRRQLQHKNQPHYVQPGGYENR